MAEITFCDRCGEPVDPACYTELCILPKGGNWPERPQYHHYGTMCMACYKVVQEILGLPYPKTFMQKYLNPRMVDWSIGSMWRRLWSQNQ